MVMPSSEAASLSSWEICHPKVTSRNNFYLKDNLGILTSTNLETSEFNFSHAGFDIGPTKICSQNRCKDQEKNICSMFLSML
jgi:hypothetical protein